MQFIRMLLFVVAGFGLSACIEGGDSAPSSLGGQGVTAIVVQKSARRMYLLHDNTVVRSYEVELGSAPDGDKYVEGDGRTPEGLYFINRKNPQSDYYMSLGISYPNNEDRAQAARLGKEPGGDIFIHGTPLQVVGKDDWTAGCIAVSDDEVREIYRLVPVGTPIWIYP